jgi:hypothetical protein
MLFSNMLATTFLNPLRAYLISLRPRGSKILKNLAKHLSIFLKYIKLVKELIEFIVPIIALSILLDNYPLETYNKL